MKKFISLLILVTALMSCEPGKRHNRFKATKYVQDDRTHLCFIVNCPYGCSYTYVPCTDEVLREVEISNILDGKETK